MDPDHGLHIKDEHSPHDILGAVTAFEFFKIKTDVTIFG